MEIEIRDEKPPKKRMGRPPILNPEIYDSLMLRVHTDEKKFFQDYCRRRKITMSDMIRQMIMALPHEEKPGRHCVVVKINKTTVHIPRSEAKVLLKELTEKLL